MDTPSDPGTPQQPASRTPSTLTIILVVVLGVDLLPRIVKMFQSLGGRNLNYQAPDATYTLIELGLVVLGGLAIWGSTKGAAWARKLNRLFSAVGIITVVGVSILLLFLIRGIS